MDYIILLTFIYYIIMATKKVVVKKEVKEVIELQEDLKKVMDRETLEVIIIDANKEPKRQTKYLHCSWKEFND